MAGLVLRLVLLVAVPGAAVYHGHAWWQDRAGHVLVYDARLATDMVTLSAAREGHLVTLDVTTGDRVTAGATLARQDTRQLDLAIAELDDELAELAAQQARIGTERALVLARNNSAEAMAVAQLAAAEAELRALEAPRSRARADLARAERLYETRVISSQAVEAARTDLESAEERATQAAAEVNENRARLQAAEVEQGRLAVLDAEVAVLEATAARLQTRRARLVAELDDAAVRVAFDAVVARTFVEAGEYLKPGTRMLMVHDPQAVWVEANVKETELHRFSPGARVVLTVDALPDAEFAGQVRWIGSSATSQFALLPNPNPSGNFTKVTQRVPIRIDFDAPPNNLRPGTMVVAKIHASHR